MPLFDNRKAKVSLCVAIFGGLILVVLVVFGFIVQKKIHDAATSRIEYDLPEGYSKNPDMQWCHERPDGEGKFSDEYYMWNLTNLDVVLEGGNAEYHLAGPYVYANYTCEFDWELDGDFMRYREVANGFHFLPGQSNGNQPSDIIININPGYLGLLKAAGGENGVLALMSGGALKQIITTLQKPESIANVQAAGRPKVLAGMNVQLLPAFAAGVSNGVLQMVLAGLPGDDDTKHNYIFNDPSANVPVAQLASTFQGFAYFINTVFGITPPPLSNSTMTMLVSTWSASNGLGIIGFVRMPNTTISVAFGVSLQEADLLLAYAAKYLINPDAISRPAVNAQMYGQWANGTFPQIDVGGGIKGWELGIPTASQLSGATVAKLFDVTSPYSLTNDTAGFMFWVGALQGNVTLAQVHAVIDPTITDAQFGMIKLWILTYTQNVAAPLLLKQFNITQWDDFAYVQWGQLVLKQSVGPTQHLAYFPEVAAFDPTTIGKPASCVHYTLEEARTALNGTNPLMDPPQAAAFFGLARAKAYSFTKTLYGLDADKTDCLYAYLATVIAPKAVLPVLNNSVHNGGGLFVARTVQEWLFTAHDPLLALLGQPADISLVNNVTQTAEEAKTKPKEPRRIYNGKNDLYTSLQPVDYPSTVPDEFWLPNADVPVTGFNGSQFMPYNAVKKSSEAETLNLWHHKVMRPVRLKYYGMTKWNGVDLAYLALDPADLASQFLNPNNAKYFSYYTGLINESSFPTNKKLPVFLSLPNFNLAEPAVYENLTLVDDIFEPIPVDASEVKARHRHHVFVLVEPYLGAAMWGNVPIQANFQYGPTDIFYPNLKHNFAPVFWNAIGDKAEDDDLDKIKDTLYFARKMSKVLIGVGAGVGGLLMILGFVGLIKFKNQYTHPN